MLWGVFLLVFGGYFWCFWFFKVFFGVFLCVFLSFWVFSFFGDFRCFMVILSVFGCFGSVLDCFCGSCKGVSRKFQGRFKKV